MARTLVYRPPLLLLDEPLSNLDAKLRERARVWLRQLQTKIGVTTVYVTHDQSEALDLSDRIAVMNRGKIVQLASPAAIYETPCDPFVADFIGSANTFRGRIVGVSGGVTQVSVGNNRTLLINGEPPGNHRGEVTVVVRPERIAMFHDDASAPAHANLFEVKVEQSSYLGARHMVTVRLDDVPLRIETDLSPKSGQTLIHIPNEACSIFVVQ